MRPTHRDPQTSYPIRGHRSAAACQRSEEETGQQHQRWTQNVATWNARHCPRPLDIKPMKFTPNMSNTVHAMRNKRRKTRSGSTERTSSQKRGRAANSFLDRWPANTPIKPCPNTARTSYIRCRRPPHIVPRTAVQRPQRRAHGKLAAWRRMAMGQGGTCLLLRRHRGCRRLTRGTSVRRLACSWARLLGHKHKHRKRQEGSLRLHLHGEAHKRR